MKPIKFDFRDMRDVVALNVMIRNLPSVIDRKICKMRIWGHTQAEIGRLLGFSQQGISYRLGRMKKYFTNS